MYKGATKNIISYAHSIVSLSTMRGFPSSSSSNSASTRSFSIRASLDCCTAVFTKHVAMSEACSDTPATLAGCGTAHPCVLRVVWPSSRGTDRSRFLCLRLPSSFRCGLRPLLPALPPIAMLRVIKPSRSLLQLPSKETATPQKFPKWHKKAANKAQKIH